MTAKKFSRTVDPHDAKSSNLINTAYFTSSVAVEH
jgi:hypothetical protein